VGNARARVHGWSQLQSHLLARVPCCGPAHPHRFGGKVGRNAVKFHATPPTITGAPTDLVTAQVSTNSGKFSFELTIRDADTAQKDIKISAAASNTKFMPASGISVSQPTADGTRVISVTPNLKEKPKKNTQYKITVSAEDKYGLKATPVVRLRGTRRAPRQARA